MASANISQHQVLKGLEYSYENYEKWGTRRGAGKHRNDGRNTPIHESGIRIKDLEIHEDGRKSLALYYHTVEYAVNDCWYR